MPAELIINVTFNETRIAFLENGLLVEFFIERKNDKSIVGNIYKGKVARVVPGMDAAFVDIGLDKSSFLYVADVVIDTGMYEEFEENGALTEANERIDEIAIDAPKMVRQQQTDGLDLFIHEICLHFTY